MILMNNWAPNTTARVRCHYLAASYNHTIQFRGLRDAAIGDVLSMAKSIAHTVFNEYITTLASDFTWISTEYAEQDSDVFVPTTNPTSITGGKTLVSYMPVHKMIATTFSGKTSGGTKGRFSLFGVYWDLLSSGDAADFIVTALEDAATADVITACNGAPLGAADGLTVNWYQRATIKPSDAWIRRVRNGI